MRPDEFDTKKFADDSYQNVVKKGLLKEPTSRPRSAVDPVPGLAETIEKLEAADPVPGKTIEELAKEFEKVTKE
ncbi:hypothetical protein KJ632_04265 [Patescibacteria group bacterium]|nr:hypothetical protein [Patescibacteria group bacterium]